MDSFRLHLTENFIDPYESTHNRYILPNKGLFTARAPSAAYYYWYLNHDRDIE